MKRSLFISFEGIDGSGKSTQIALLKRFLEEKTVVCLTREPGGCTIAEEIRTLILSSKSDLAATGELYLYLAARAEHVRQVINPALEQGKTVISDRFADSTFAYQGAGRGLPLDTMAKLNDFATGGRKPDITILLDISVAVSRGRIAVNRGGECDRIEQNSEVFFEKVRQQYLLLAKNEPNRFVVIDGELPVDEIAETIRQKVEGIWNEME